MLPSMAAQVPGGCAEVDQSLCGTSPGGISTNPGTAPGNSADGPTEITVLVKEPMELQPYTHGADVVIQSFNIRNFNQTTGAPILTEIFRGKTDETGKFVWSGQAPSPNTDYRYQVLISLPGQAWPKTIHVPARDAASAAAGNRMVSKSEIVVVVCPPNIDPIICAVADARLDVLATRKQMTVIDPPGGSMMFKNPRLMAHFDVFKYWISDEEIPPKDWPDLVNNYDQAWAVFTAIPFPKWPGIPHLFQDCARAIPIGQGKNAERYSVASPRLYSKTWSNYFPRTDKQINTDMSVYVLALQPILACMQRRIEKKIEETKKTMRTMAIISYCIMLVNLPLLIASGVGGFAAIATETFDFVKLAGGKEPLGVGVTAGIAAASLAAGDPAIVAAALEPIVNGLVSDMDSIAASAVKMVYPQVVRFAIGAVGSIASNSVATGSNTIVNGATSFVSAATIASAVAVMAVKAFASIPKMYAAKRVEELGDALAGAQAAASDVVAFISGEEVSEAFKPFLIWAVEAMGLVDMVNQAIDDFLNQFQQALEAGQQQGGGIAVVPEQDGGGPAVVPTDPAGTPTDVHGDPLPGGTAPLTPPSGGSTIPGISPPPMPPPPTTMATPGMGGVSTLGAAAGVGGATLALLLVTGAIS